MKEIVDKLDFTEIKNFCSADDNVRRMRGQAIGWGRYLQTHLIKDCYPKYTRNS